MGVFLLVGGRPGMVDAPTTNGLGPDRHPPREISSCPNRNLDPGAAVRGSAKSCQHLRLPMARRVRLRPWQKRALDGLAASDAPDFLAVATPGAGKTTFALCAAVHDVAANPGRRLVVAAPTSHLKVQWADAGERFGLNLEPSWNPSRERLPADVHGIVTTYQQVASSPDALRTYASQAMVILDEIHHAGDDRAWGSSVRQAFELAPRRLSLSGTPFRSDTLSIPFVNYIGEVARPDFEYGYADALADGRVVRPVYFPRINGFMEWIAPDGAAASASFDDAL